MPDGRLAAHGGGSGTLVLAGVRCRVRGVAALRLDISCMCRSPQARPIGSWCSWCGLRLGVLHVGRALVGAALLSLLMRVTRLFSTNRAADTSCAADIVLQDQSASDKPSHNERGMAW